MLSPTVRFAGAWLMLSVTEDRMTSGFYFFCSCSPGISQQYSQVGQVGHDLDDVDATVPI